MQIRRVFALLAFGLLGAASLATTTMLPTGWRLSPPSGPLETIGTFPQSLSLSPNGAWLAVLESGAAPAALRVVDPQTLETLRTVPLKGGFGVPVWTDDEHLLVAGANTDAVLAIDATDGTTRTIPTGDGTYPVAVAFAAQRHLIASANDLDASVSVAAFDGSHVPTGIPVGSHPGAVAFSRDEQTLFVALRAESAVIAIDVTTHATTSIPVGLHPCALAVDTAHLYVAQCDDDAVRVIDLASRKTIADIPVGIHGSRVHGYGASPNALAVRDDKLYVTLGAANAVAVIDLPTRAVAYLPAGWYPSGVAVDGDRLFVANAKGESSHANPGYKPFSTGKQPQYVALLLKGSIRVLRSDAFSDATTSEVLGNAAPQWTPPTQTILRPGGPIKHVIYIIKENRSYDEILADLPQGDGDMHLLWFGEKATPNQHAIARRFGLFDRTFTDAQVSADGHNWSTAAFANDYLERFWPSQYGGRRPLYDFEDGARASRPHSGYLWDAATRAHVSFRDYGEFVTNPELQGDVTTHMEHLVGHIAPHYPGFDLQISDDVRYRAWKTEFDGYVARGDLPQLEIVRLPDDHTTGSRPGSRTPLAHIASNDYAFGRIVDAVSHSRYWSSTAIFAIEDDAQDGPDHVNDQRTTFYVASPYAQPGVHHEHYTTASVLHTIELILGIEPMSIYDTVAPPLYDAFGSTARSQPFTAVRPNADLGAINAKTAYGAQESARMDFTHADAVDDGRLNDILAHNHPR